MNRKVKGAPEAAAQCRPACNTGKTRIPTKDSEPRNGGTSQLSAPSRQEPRIRTKTRKGPGSPGLVEKASGDHSPGQTRILEGLIANY